MQTFAAQFALVVTACTSAGCSDVEVFLGRLPTPPPVVVTVPDAGSDPPGDVVDAMAPPQARTAWVATASASSISGDPGTPLYNPPEQAIDGNLATRWSSGAPQSGTEWFQLDFGSSVELTGMTLVGGEVDRSPDDWPRIYSVTLTDAPGNFSATPFATGQGMAGGLSLVLDEPVTGRYLLIQQSGASEFWWSIHELFVDAN